MKNLALKIINFLFIIAIILLLFFPIEETVGINEEVKLEKLSFVEKNIKIKPNRASTLGISTYPKAANDYEIIFTSSNTDIALVDEEGKIKPRKPGKVTITVSTKDGKLKDECEVTVLKEYLLFFGDSNWELIAGERKGGDTKEVYEIDYKNYVKDNDLFFVTKSGAGLKWMSGRISEELEEIGYAKVGEKDNASDEVKEIISDNEDAYFKIIISMGTNDLKLTNSKEEVEKYAKAYAEFYNELANDLFNQELYIYSVIPIGKKDSCEIITDNDFKESEHRNTKVEIFNNTLEQELNDDINFVNIYTYFNFLASKNKMCFTSDGHWNKEITQKVYNKVIESID